MALDEFDPSFTPPATGGSYVSEVNPKRDDLDAPVEGEDYSLINRYRARSVDDYAQVPMYYLFFTAPSLNLGANTLKVMNFAHYLSEDKMGKKLILSLSCNTGSSRGETPAEGKQKLMKLLTNCCEGFSPSDTSTGTVNVGETRFRHKQTYVAEDADSTGSGSFSVEYMEKPGLPVVKLHKLWYDYMQAIRKGMIKPFDYIREHRLLDYQVAAYYFALAPDGVSIEYWAKYTGVMPTAVPYSAFAGKPGGGEPVKVTIPYSFVYKEDMEPDILADFNDSVTGTPRLGDIWGKAILADMEGVSGDWQSAFDPNSIQRAAAGVWNWIRGVQDVNFGAYNDEIPFNIEPPRDERTWASTDVRVNRFTVEGRTRYGLFFENDISDNTIKDFD